MIPILRFLREDKENKDIQKWMEILLREATQPFIFLLP